MYCHVIESVSDKFDIIIVGVVWMCIKLFLCCLVC